jgi:hypothetical protein
LFSNWASGWNAGPAGQLNQCGFLNEKNSFWNTTSCTAQNDFICKISKGYLKLFDLIFAVELISFYSF